MASERQADLKLFMDWRATGSTGVVPAQTLAALLWPYINTQDLSKVGHLEQMLHTRGRHPIDYFAVQDMPASRVSLLNYF